MIHNYPYTDFHELNLDYLMKLARESMGLHFEQADKFLKLVNAQGQEVSRAKIYYAETALKDDLGNNIDAYIISTALQGDNIIFTKGNGEYTTVTIPYAVKASKDVNNVDLTSYIHGLSVAGDKLLITYGNGETASITVPYAVKASTDENGKSITTYVADLSTGNNKLIVKDGDGTTIAELTIPYATSALNDVDGDAIKSTYGTDLTTDTTTVQLRSKDGAIISTITVPYATKALSDDQGNNFRSDYGFNLAVDGNKVALEAHDGTTLNEITVPFATLATDATNAIESVSISGDEIVFTTYGGNSYRITSPYAVKALKDNLNNTITTTYVASVTNDPDTGEISFYASDGSLISTLIPTLDSAIHDSYGNLIGDFVKEIIVNPQNNYVVVNHGTGDSDTLTINYATHAYKDTYENVIGNTYIRSLSIITDTSTNTKYLVAYNGELSELFRIAVDDFQTELTPIVIDVDRVASPQVVTQVVTVDGSTETVIDSATAIDLYYKGSSVFVRFNSDPTLHPIDTVAIVNGVMMVTAHYTTSTPAKGIFNNVSVFIINVNDSTVTSTVYTISNFRITNEVIDNVSTTLPAGYMDVRDVTVTGLPVLDPTHKPTIIECSPDEDQIWNNDVIIVNAHFVRYQTASTAIFRYTLFNPTSSPQTLSGGVKLKICS